MNKNTARYLLHKANELAAEADTLGKGPAASIIRKASKNIKDTVPMEYRLEELLDDEFTQMLKGSL